MLFSKFSHYCRGQAAGFIAENKNIVRAKAWCVKTLAALGGHREQAAAGQSGLADRPVSMPVDPGKLVVIQTGTFEGAILPAETEWFDQMQFDAGIGAQADNVTGIGWDFGLEQNDCGQN